MKPILISLFIFSSILGYGQSGYQDSLYKLLLGKIPDTSKALVLNQIAESFHGKNDNLSIKEAKRALDYSLKTKHKKYLVRSYYNIGMGYSNVNRFSDAQESYFKSLKIAEEIDYTDFLLRNYNQIGIIYSFNRNVKNANKYFKKFVAVAEKTGEKVNLARGYNNLGISLKNLGQFEEAIVYYRKALRVFKEMDYLYGVISCNSNIGVVNMSLKNYDSALIYHNRSHELAFNAKDTFSMAISSLNKAELLWFQNKYDEAIVLYREAINLSKKTKLLQQLRDGYQGLYMSYEKKLNYKEAYLNHKQYLKLRDSIFNDETNAKLSMAESNYEQVILEQEIERKEQNAKIEKAKKEKEIAQANAQNAESQKYIWVLIIIVFFIIILLYFLYNRNKEKSKANLLLQQQRDEIAESKKEITDSINYALRIQQAVLPKENLLANYFKESFILYHPKDIVSGDFYWFTEIQKSFIIAAADCTGHGVPGGFMSMIGTDKLNQAVFEKGIHHPGKILNSLNEGIKASLKQDNSIDSSRDGMDISLGKFTKLENAKVKLEWAGANRPLWLIKDKEFIEYKANKMGIGGFSSEIVSFDTHEILIEKNTCIYLFSDGFADQFGGKDNKKMTTKKFKEYLIGISHLPMEKQKSMLLSFFHEWRNELSQIDDVLVIGLRIEI